VLALAASLALSACVNKEDLSDPEALMSGSGSGSSSSDDGASSATATSTTGEGTCASNDGTRTSMDIYAGPAEDPMLYGIEDVAFTDAGDVAIAFIQGNHEWAMQHADGSIDFADPPGTLAHVGLVRTVPGGRWAVANSSLFDPADWVQLVEADGTVAWNGEWVIDEQWNYIIDQLVAFPDGSALAQVSWIDDAAHGTLAHFGTDGTLLQEIDVSGALRGRMVGTADGTVWVLQGVEGGTAVQRYTADDYTTAAQSLPLPSRWGQRLHLDAQGRPVIVSQDLVRTGPSSEPVMWVDVLDPVSGDLVHSYNNVDTPGMGVAVDAAVGPCGELFVVGARDYKAWIARLDEDGVAWEDQLEVDAALYADVAEDGTLVVVGQSSVPDASVLTIGPWVARYEP
jgi:hypothetical protein